MKGKNSKSKPKDKSTPEEENVYIDSTKEEIICNDSCSGDSNSASIRCNLCFVWYHSNCVGIDDLDCVEVWVCADCQTLPRTYKSLKIQMETLFKTQANLFKAFTVFSEKMDNKFENLNDRLTVISNQNKNYNQSCTSSLSNIHQEVTNLKTEMDKKSNAILSKNQCIIDHMKSQPGPVRTETPNNQTNPTKKKSIGGLNEAVISAVVQAPAITETQPKKSPTVETTPTSEQKPVVDLTQSENENEVAPPQAKTRDLTFLNGSSILQNIKNKVSKK